LSQKSTSLDSDLNVITDYDPNKATWEDVVVNQLKPSKKVRPEILNSWIRCRDLGLDPLIKHYPKVISKSKLLRLQNKYRDFIEIAKPVMQMIEISVRGTGFIVTLAEKSGHVLETFGDRDVLKMAIKNFYVPGCLRSIAHAGTNAIGLCLDEKRPIQITGAEHYNINHHPWTCSSAPIRNSNGNMIGVITLSGKSIGHHKHTLALITAAAKNIESQLRERDLIERSQRLNSMLTLIYNSLSDGIIAIDNQLHITHVNQTAQKMLGIGAKTFLGRSFYDLANIDSRLKEQFQTGDYIETTEISFNCQSGIQNFMCRVDPIQTQAFKLLGLIVTMAEKRQMISIAKKISGNYSKFEFADIQGKNAQFVKQIEFAKVAAKTNSRILIIGESGTGKELFAHAIHSCSNCRNGPFVAISCAAIPRDLIESELFGYRGGAFTGARQRGMMGKFELADKGTLFLDEIDGLPMDLQAKLLRALQQREIMRLGDNKTIPVDVRIISASNKELMVEVENNNFREDLYYRLNVVEIYIPPLRDRKEDIELLANHIIDRQCIEMAVKRPNISNDAMRLLKEFDWPGNVRELENAIERALLLCQGDKIRPKYLPLRSRKDFRKEKNRVLSIKQGFKKMIESALEESNGNISLAAQQLDIARSTLYRKMREFGINT
jgi:transcriptional regulator of acetoin/glycerol metabolism